MTESKMGDDARVAFLSEVRLGNISIRRVGKGPLLAPIWYSYTPGGTLDMCMGASSAKAHRIRAEGRATLSVVDPGTTGLSRYVTWTWGDLPLDELHRPTSRRYRTRGSADRPTERRAVRAAVGRIGAVG